MHSRSMKLAAALGMLLAAQTSAGLIMGVRHRELPIHGVQFHPESIRTLVGKDLLRNFVAGIRFAR